MLHILKLWDNKNS